MERQAANEPAQPEPRPTEERKPYEPPRVEAVRLTGEAAEALT